MTSLMTILQVATSGSCNRNWSAILMYDFGGNRIIHNIENQLTAFDDTQYDNFYSQLTGSNNDKKLSKADRSAR